MRILSAIFLVLAVAFGMSARTYSVSDVPNVHVADRTRYVSNPDGILSPSAEAQINTMLSSLWDSTSAEVVVVVVDKIDTDIDSFATELFGEWGIGKRDNSNGLLLLVSRDDRKMVIRTGYGMEGVVPDVLAGRIIRNLMAPRFREEDYDGGVIDAVAEISRLTTDPVHREEILSQYENDRQPADNFGDDIFRWWLTIGAVIAAVLIVVVFVIAFTTRKQPEFRRYQALNTLKLTYLVVGILFVGIPLVSFLVLWLMMRRVRLHKRLCPNCNHRMHRLGEQADNAYLTPAQDMEEQLKSVDYDVWLCDNCHETDIIPYINPLSNYQVCPHCGAKASALTAQRTTIPPTTRSQGQVVKEYTCMNCRQKTLRKYVIPMLEVAPVFISGGRGGSGGGGGFSGGSFGGGFTGGGGASGGW